RVFLYATRAGLLDLHWDVLCPNCRVAKNQVGSLADLSREAHCDTCNIRYDVNFDEYVELRFTVSDAVREVYQATFCIAAPYQTRHILAQFNLAPGNTHTLAVDFGPGTYRWRTRQRTERGDVQVGPDGGPGPLHYRFTAGDVDGPVGTPALRPGGAIHFENSSGTDLLLIFEQAGWGLDGVSAALVTSLQEFRTLFSSQVLAPGLSVAVKNLTVLFSDLKESTTLYDRMGDSAAYASVRDHFVIMSNTIAAHNGAVVKTIGDAVMAVFSTPSHAVEACLAIQRGITLYNETATDDHITVKLGLHSGPCLAINANDVLDYFGSTVNIASRVQGASGGADVILTDRVYADPAVHHLLAGLPVQSFTASLKGISQVFTLYRVVPNSPMTAPPLRALAGTA
ncbi:MAG TPA: adenylate/guanylate cyclase domain-containing protein, partial [Chloroflexia bacterium]|nr:adenylate/guanylate cyclase domain-containing protein [Chloroflexia bacterium]